MTQKSLLLVVPASLRYILLHSKLLRPASDVKRTQMLMDVMESGQFDINKLYLYGQRKRYRLIRDV